MPIMFLCDAILYKTCSFFTTRSSQHRLLNLTTLLGIIILVCIFPKPQQLCNAQDILSRVPAGIFSSPTTSSRNSGTDNNLGEMESPV